jgi:hypothetical protein
MSTVMRRRRGSRLQLGPYRRHELLGGVATYPVQGYDGYGDGRDTDMRKFISAEMKADWAANRAALMEFWESGMSDAEAYPHDCLPWLCLGPRDRVPWAVRFLD